MLFWVNMPVMRKRRLGFLAASAAVLAQGPYADQTDLWRKIRTSLNSGHGYFSMIEDSQIPPSHGRFHGWVVSQPSKTELIVNVDDPAGDADLRLKEGTSAPAAIGTPVYFEGVVKSYTTNPYRLTLEVLPSEIEGLP